MVLRPSGGRYGKPRHFIGSTHARGKIPGWPGRILRTGAWRQGRGGSGTARGNRREANRRSDSGQRGSGGAGEESGRARAAEGRAGPGGGGQYVVLGGRVR